MRLRNKQSMSFVDGADIQKSYQLFGFKDGCARDIPTCDFTKNTIFML